MNNQILFNKVAIECGKRYIASGGPTTRIEESLVSAGQSSGFETEASATPTGIFVNTYSPENQNSQTDLARIKSGRMDLNELSFIENCLRSLSDCKLTLEEVQTLLTQNKMGSLTYPLLFFFFAPFMIGFFASYPRFESYTAAFFSGLLTFFVFYAIDVYQSRLKLNGIFTVFSSCLLTFLMSFALSHYFQLPPESFVIGTLIFLVPGLTLTTAISELADHNLVSGTAKMMNGVLILLAMGIAYLLILELNSKLFLIPIEGAVLPLKDLSENFWVQFFSNIFLIAGFAIYLNVPLKSLFWSTLTGITGWLIFKILQEPSLIVLASFCASFCVGILSLLFSVIFKNPSQTYSVPGILSLLPGLLALSTFDSGSLGNPDQSTTFRVALTGGSIVFGLISARIPALFFRKRALFE